MDWQTTVAAAQFGDSTAYSNLVTKYYDYAVNNAERYLHDHHLAEDAVQEAFVEAYLKLQQLKVPEAFPAWFRQVLRSKCRSVSRKSSKNPIPWADTSNIVDDYLSPPDVLLQHEISRCVWQAVDTLSPPLREACTLYFSKELSYQEISENLGISLSAVKKRLFDARIRVRKILSEDHSLPYGDDVSSDSTADARRLVMSVAFENTKALLSKRTLDTCYELRQFLSPGMKILDTGCGAGTISSDVAEAIRPGDVVAIDRDKAWVEYAEMLARKKRVRNIAFRKMDALALDFPDQTFDLVYSNNLLHRFADPMQLLAEQKRVTKSGGWVVACGIRDLGMVKRHPPCPAWEHLIEVYGKASENPEIAPELNFGWNILLGRRVPELFASAKLSDFTIGVKSDRVRYHGSPEMGPFVLDVLPWEGDDPYGHFEKVRHAFEVLVDRGIVSQIEIDAGIKEARDWYANPNAFHFNVFIWAAGRA